MRGLLAVGPFLFLHALFLNSPAFVASQTTLGLPAALAVILVADALAIFGAEAAARWRGASFLAVGLIGVVALRDEVGLEVMGAVALATIGTAGMLAIALRPGRGERALALALAGGAAMIVSFGLALVYQLAYDRELGFPNRFLLSASALVLLALAFTSRMRSVVAVPPRGHLIALWPLAMLAVPGALWFGARGTDAAPAPPAELRIATYNLHLGVRIDDGRVDLESFADAIEGLDADVLVLQEVGRGWPVNGMTDVAEWLSWRLDVPYVYAPAADGQMGNAIATRHPLSATSAGTLPQAGGLMVRSYVSVTLALETGEVRVVGTHLQHRPRDVDARLAEIDVLLEALGSAEGTVLAGDMNAEPGSQEIDRLEAFGFVSSQEALGTDVATSWRDGTQIDFVFAGPAVRVTSGDVASDARASDHLPLVATVALA